MSLTAKQQRFDELLASGSTKVDAFRQAYPSAGRSKGTEWEGAKRVARHPAVAAEVQRLALLRSPHDMVAQAEHVSAKLLELTKSDDPAVALRAIREWAKLASAGLLKPPPITARVENARPPSAEERREIINQLREIYANALPKEKNGTKPLGRSRPEPTKPYSLVVDVEPNGTATAVAAGPSDREELLSASLPTSNDEDFGMTTVGDDETEPALGAEAVADGSTGEWKLTPIPGSFPQRFQRVRRN